MILLQIITIASSFFIKQFTFPKSIFFITFFIQLILLSLWRYLVQNVRKYVHSEKNIMIIGDSEVAEKLAKKLITSSKGWYDIKYILEPEKFLSSKEYVKEIDVVYICNKVDEKIKSDIISEAIKIKKHIFIVLNFKDILLT
ncbi:hypothetical protein Q2T46_10720 [Thermoanaerobacterium sp. CMT5567-10]|uniref:hypothetical protein n=1 Tax=Thermoanaerobacterium sp. CMT5567-10 TaxID=3061989 RepID=UPI0026E015C4|nr:hypothetical protein [Thermoanaerobacterium sp. CMT5567-10]WKV08016.1 hypothetical protein Q2T46_10720 [Thermoanaerobacterium sp. CMT5567-10]